MFPGYECLQKLGDIFFKWVGDTALGFLRRFFPKFWLISA